MKFIPIIIFVLLSSCVVAQKKGIIDPKKEDYTEYRPTYSYNIDSISVSENNESAGSDSLVPVYTVQKQLDETIDSIRNLNEKIEYIKSLRVLAYSGNDRNMAMKIRKVILEAYPDWQVDLTYKQPYFKVFVGQFTQQIEAARTNYLIQNIELDEEDFEEMESLHPLIVPDKQKIR